MAVSRQHYTGRSQLFLVRLWAEESKDGSDSESSVASDDQIEWCRKLQHVVSGQARYFRGCPQLTATLLEMMQDAEAEAVPT